MTAYPQIEESPDAPRAFGARSQVLFRQLNEQIGSLADIFGDGKDFDLVCECTNGGCFERLAVSREAYEAIRRFPTRFVVKAGHAAHDVERVVEETREYLVVEKVGSDAGSAIRLDPRRNGTRGANL